MRSAFLLQVSGAVVPALVMLLTVPLIRAQLDLDMFAAFTVMLSAVGLLAALDGGLGRASTYFVRLALTRGDGSRVVVVFQGVLVVGLIFSVVLGLAVGIGLCIASGRALAIAKPALLILACFSPIFVAGSLLRGFLEAQQNFGRSTALQLSHGAFIGIAPVLLFSISDDLRLFAWTVGLARLVLTLALLQSCGLANRRILAMSSKTRTHAARVFDYSKWLFISNLIGLTIIFADRFFVASVFSSAIIAAYVLPMEVIGRLQILIAAFCSVLFPRLVGRSAATPAVSGQLLANAQGLVLCCAALAGSAVALVADPLMSWWLGSALAGDAARVLVVGVVGAGLMASAALAMLYLNSRGLTRPLALLHAMEMPAYIALLYFAARSGSINSMLSVWVLRLSADAIGMSVICRRTFKSTAGGGAAPFVNSVHWAMVLLSLSALLFVGLSASSISLFDRSVVGLLGVAAAIFAGREFVLRVRRSTLLANRIA